jgi:hypothetical protein
MLPGTDHLFTKQLLCQLSYAGVHPERVAGLVSLDRF